MSGSRLTSAQLDQVRELHGAVRKWIEASAAAPKQERLRETVPYADLMFAFGFATLGDRPTTDRLVEDARRLLDGPIPPCLDPKKDADPVAIRVLRAFLLKALRFRVERALAREPHAGPLSADLFDELERIEETATNPYQLASLYVVRFREQYRILEPTERVDPYASWKKHSCALERELAELHALHKPNELAGRVRKLFEAGVGGEPLAEVRFCVLHEGLPLATRVGEHFAAELLTEVPAALQGDLGSATGYRAMPNKQSELLERAMLLAGHFGRRDIAVRLVDTLCAFVRSRPKDVRFGLINGVARQYLRSLKRLGLPGEIDRVMTQLHAEVLDGLSVVELRKKYAAHPESWAAVLQTLLNLAAGLWHFALIDRATPIRAEARNELLGPGTAFQPKDYTELARAYVAALGHSPFVEESLAQMIELFHKMPRASITNTWTSAPYYSRFHLNLVEDTVLAVCDIAGDGAAPAVVSA